jgi:heat shock protein HslJ
MHWQWSVQTLCRVWRMPGAVFLCLLARRHRQAPFTPQVVESATEGGFTMKICLLLLPLAVATCMTMPESAVHAATTTAESASAPLSPDTLARYHWQLHDAVDTSGKRLDALFGLPDKPLQLDFTADKIHVKNACNGIGGSYLIVEGRLDVAPMMHTMMACHDQTLMQRENTITAMLGSKPTLILSTAGGTPMLTLAADNGQTLTFAGNTSEEH